jgi:hypothetical protein
MASATGGFRLIGLMTAQATVHRSDAGDFGYAIHFRNLAVTVLAFGACVEVSAMTPERAGQQLIDAYPRNCLTGFGIFGQLRKIWFRLPDILMARHANAGCGKCHLISGLRIYVTELAFESHGDVLLVAVRQRLFGRGGIHGIRRDYSLDRLIRRVHGEGKSSQAQSQSHESKKSSCR